MVYDVAIIGLGPVGAALAGLLGKRGLRVVAIEKDPRIFQLPRAAHVDHTGLRTIQEIGCLDTMLPTLVRNRRLDLLNARHEVLLSIPADQPSVSGLPTSVYFYQPEFDTILREKAASYATVDVRLGTEMTGLDQDDTGVSIRTRDSDGVETAFRASRVVGCDGAWSPVREAMGITLENLDFDEKWLVLDLKLTRDVPGLPVDFAIEVCDPSRPYLSTPLAPGRQRFEFMMLPGEDPEHVRQAHVVGRLLANWLPDGSYEIQRSAVYTFHGLLARQWRKGRVMVAGDAAHQTPPFLGQGMCAGIRDAANLAWKLERVILNGAPEALLDTYQSERSPHARKVIEAAIRIGKVICETDPAKAAERDEALLAGDQDTRRRLAFALPSLEPGPIVLSGAGQIFVQPMVRDRLLDDIVGSRFFVLARTHASLGTSFHWWKDEMKALVATLDEFDEVPALGAWLDKRQADVIVVRPDRYVLGAARTLDDITPIVAPLLAS